MGGYYCRTGELVEGTVVVLLYCRDICFRNASMDLALVVIVREDGVEQPDLALLLAV